MVLKPSGVFEVTTIEGGRRCRTWRNLFLAIIGLCRFISSVAYAESTNPPWHGDKADLPYNFISWALRPDGQAAAFVVASATGNSAALLFEDLKSRQVTEIAGWHGSSLVRPEFLPTWSPDGSNLAYFQPTATVSRLSVWRPRGGYRQTFSRDACALRNAFGCRGSQIAWTKDGRYIYFLAQPVGGAAQSQEIVQKSPKQADPLWRRLLYADPDNGGVTVRETTKQPRSRSLLPDSIPADVVIADTRTLALKTALTCTGAIGLLMAPDGKHILALANSGREGNFPQFYTDFFVLPVEGKGGFQDLATRTACPVRSGAETLPLLHQVKQPGEAITWSPDSKFFAFVEKGALARGDVILANATTGKLTNLTVGRLPREGNEAAPAIAVLARNYRAPGAKFNDATRLVWSARGNAIFVLRKAQYGGDWKTRLWKVPIAGRPVDLSADLPYSVGLPIFEDSGKAAADPRLVVPAERQGGQSAFIEFSEKFAKPTVIAKIVGGIRAALSSSADQSTAGTDILFTSEGAYAPQEAYLFKERYRQLYKLTFVNAAIDPGKLPSRHLVVWKGADKRQHFGYLYASARQTELPPLVVQIYPRYSYSEPLSGESFVGNSNTFMPPLKTLLDSGYAIFKPDIPVVGHGKTCDDVAQNLELALAKIREMQLADVNRAAIFGHSFGGWAVGCAITRTSGFRAAVSVAGISDWISMGFSGLPAAAEQGIGGGQAEIGSSVLDAPELYWRESPVSKAANAATPLLLIHGKMDNVVPVDQSVEMFTALSLWGRDATLVTFDGAGHASILERPDYRKRVVDWIESHLGRVAESAQTGSKLTERRHAQ